MNETGTKKENKLTHIERLLKRYPQLKESSTEIEAAYKEMEAAYLNKKKLLVCGNGGSASDAEHIVGELMKGFYKQRKLNAEQQKIYGDLGEYLQGALPAIALTQHTALSTAFLNDVNPYMIFAQQVYGYGESGDILLCISTSGNAVNVANAAKVAKIKGLKVIGLTGKDGGTLKTLSDVCVVVQGSITADIQELHLPIYHTWCAMLEDYFFT